MRRVRIVTDSTADVPAGLASELDISVVPVQVRSGQEEYQGGIDLLPQTLYGGQAQHPELAQGPEFAPVSQPPLGRFVETYRRLLDKEQSDAVLSIHSAESVRGTVNVAWSASQMLPDPSRVEIIDTGQLSMAIGWIAVEAARVAKAGATQAEVGQVVRDLLPRLRMVAMIDDLETLHEDGQITLVSAALGSVLQIKALASLQDGELVVWEKVRTRARALKRLVDQVREWEPLVEMAVLHTGAEELAQYLAEAVHDLVPARRMLVLPAGPVLTGLVGLDAIGVAAVVVAES